MSWLRIAFIISIITLSRITANQITLDNAIFTWIILAIISVAWIYLEE